MKRSLTYRLWTVLFASVLSASLIPARIAGAAGAGSVTAGHQDAAGTFVPGDFTMNVGDQVQLGWNVVTLDGTETSYASVHWADGNGYYLPGLSGVTWASSDGATSSNSGSVIAFSLTTFPFRVPPYAGVSYTITGLAPGTTTLTITTTFINDTGTMTTTATDSVLVTVVSPGGGTTPGGGAVSSVTLTDGAVTVTGDLPDNVELVATPVSQESDARYRVFAGDVGNKDVLGLFDIKLIDTSTGMEYELPAGQSVTVSISDLDLAGAQGVTIAHQKADGSLEYIAAGVNGGTVTFAASSFSLYGVVADKNQPAQVKSPSSLGLESGTSLPQTSDSANLSVLALGSLMLLVAAEALTLFYRRKIS